jgi:hypothetical protein
MSYIINGQKKIYMTIPFGQWNIYNVCFIKTGCYVTQMLTWYVLFANKGIDF